jgi:uncharacterized membrane protein YgaE (UPF0421/DUF939 family)
MGNIIQERIGVVIGSLIIAFILGGITVVVTLAVADEKIDQLEKRQTKHEQIAEKSLEKIDAHLQKIADAIEKQALEAARSHHDHPR